MKIMKKLLFIIILLNINLVYAGTCGCAKVNVNNPTYQEEVEEQVETVPVEVNKANQEYKSPITGAAVTELEYKEDNNFMYLISVVLLLIIINIY